MKTSVISHALSAVLAIGLLIPSASAAIITLDAPVAGSLTPDILYYNLDSATGATVTNTSSTSPSYNGTLNTGSFTAPSIVHDDVMEGFGGALSLSGGSKVSGSTQNPYVLVSGSGALNFNAQSFTLGKWLAFDSFLPITEMQRVILFDKGGLNYNSAGSGGFTFYIERAADSSAWQLILQTRNGSQSATARSLDIAFTLEDWNHFGMSFDHVAKSVSFWLNGSLIATDINATYVDIASTTGRGATIGERQTSSYSSVFDGRIDDFFITSGVHTFAIPEPSALKLLGGLLLGAAGLYSRRATRRRFR